MNIVDKIIMEAQISVETLFNGHDTNRYAFIWRDVTKYNTIEKKRALAKKLEDYRLKSGDGLPIKKLNPQLFVATQDTVDSDKIKKFANIKDKIDALPFVVKLNGVYYAIDGHHRTSVALITEKDYIDVRFLDLDEGNFA